MKFGYNNSTKGTSKGGNAMGDTDFLFAMPSFVTGIAATLDVGSTFTVYNDSDSISEADVRALKSDWAMIGKDIFNAMRNYEQTTCKAE